MVSAEGTAEDGGRWRGTGQEVARASCQDSAMLFLTTSGCQASDKGSQQDRRIPAVLIELPRPLTELYRQEGR
jgi:hypothetical protein